MLGSQIVIVQAELALHGVPRSSLMGCSEVFHIAKSAAGSGFPAPWRLIGSFRKIGLLMMSFLGRGWLGCSGVLLRSGPCALVEIR